MIKEFEGKNSRKNLKESFQNAKPFKHVVIDNFLTTEHAEELHQKFPSIKSEKWIIDYDDNKTPILYAKDNPFEGMLISISDKKKFPTVYKDLFDYFDTQEFIEYIQEITGITGLMPDTTGRHAGIRGMINESFQHIHSDAVLHPETGLEKRLTMILYLNPAWKSSYGGELELWDDDISKCVKKITPSFNRLVIFECTKTSYHGVPNKLNLDEGGIRKSIILSYMCAKGKDNIGRKRAKFVSTPENKFTEEMKILSDKRSKVNTNAKYRFKK